MRWVRRWCLVKVVFLQKLYGIVSWDSDLVFVSSRAYLFSHLSTMHLYGRFPVCMRRCRARLEDCEDVSDSGCLP